MKVHQVVITVIDFDNLGADGVREELRCSRFPNDCMRLSVRRIDTREVEWSDKHPLNNSATKEAELCRLFGSVA